MLTKWLRPIQCFGGGYCPALSDVLVFFLWLPWLASFIFCFARINRKHLTCPIQMTTWQAVCLVSTALRAVLLVKAWRLPSNSTRALVLCSGRPWKESQPPPTPISMLNICNGMFFVLFYKTDRQIIRWSNSTFRVREVDIPCSGVNVLPCAGCRPSLIRWSAQPQRSHRGVKSAGSVGGAESGHGSF